MTAVLFLLRAVILILLWSFVLAAIMAVRSDIFGVRKRKTKPAAAPARPAPAPAPARGKATPQPAQPAPQPAPQSKAQPQLVVIEGNASRPTVPLTGAPVTIGRSSDSTLVLTDDYASGKHARLTANGDDWLLEDLGSTNGTFIGRQRVTAPTRITPGTRIRIGKTVIELRR